MKQRDRLRERVKVLRKLDNSKRSLEYVEYVGRWYKGVSKGERSNLLIFGSLSLRELLDV